MTMTAQKFQTIDRAALKAKLDNKEKFQLWNVLGKEFYKPESNIAGSQWVSADTITAELPVVKAAAKADLIVVYCAGKTCAASKQAAENLAAMGYTNVSAYEGGLQDWTEAGFPLVKL